MNKKLDDATRDKILDELLEKHAALDDICREIFLTLWAYKKLRFNELLRALKKLGIKITQPTLTDHLQHLIEKRIVEKEDGYSLREDINSVLHPSQEELREWLEVFRNDKNLPGRLRPLKITGKEFYSLLTDNEVDRMAVKDLADTLSLNLHELKSFVNYDLEIGKFESDAAFWKFVGNPMYRMQEKTIVEKCRNSEKYMNSLFEKIDVFIDEFRSDKEFFRERKEKALRK